MNNLKLTIELVPKTCWYSNVRSNVSKSEWDIIRKKCYEKANNVCEIWGDVGTNQGIRHKVECHEIWTYKDDTKEQILEGLISLCPRCHKTKHVGLAQMNGELEIVIRQLMIVNDMDRDEAEEYITDAFTVWGERSRFNWTLDISYLSKYY